MASDTVCPFYGKSDDYCDVGCGYISPYDVNLIRAILLDEAPGRGYIPKHLEKAGMV